MTLGFDINKIGKGLVSIGIPFVFKGIINEFLTERQVSVTIAVDWVQNKKDLLTLFKEFGGGDFEDMLQRAHTFVSDADWLTSEYLIDSCRDEHPAIASLFLGWDEARVWLDIQTEELRKAFSHQEPVTAPPTPTTPPPVPQHSADTPPGSTVSELGIETTKIAEERI